MVIRKDKSNLDKYQKDVNARMNSFCKQKDISLTDNCNLDELHPGTKKLHQNNEGYSDFAKNILHFVESRIADTDIFGELRVWHAFKDKPL